ncbi:MAG: hypothetical protein ACJAVY_000484 [Marinoscillum sp.]|jgi:uncharacterized protein (TIGR00730 family)
MIKNVAVFCGSSKGNNPLYSEVAEQIGKVLAKRQIGVVYGGGNIGLMGVVADAAMANGGKVIGVIPRKLMELEVGHQNITELHVVESMHERKAMMAALSDAFIALPGGIGTIEEIVEVYTWQQIGYHEKPCIIFNMNGYYDPFLSFLNHSVEEGFLSKSQHDRLLVVNDVDELINLLL